MKQKQEIIKKEPSENTIYENMIAQIKNQIHGIVSKMDISEND